MAGEVTASDQSGDLGRCPLHVEQHHAQLGARSGDRLYQQRLGEGTSAFTASPVAGDGKIYVASEEGDVYVIQAGPEYRLLARNSMGQVCMTTPAISGGMLLFRTQSQVIAVGGHAGRN